jgi:hypothetical protein
VNETGTPRYTLFLPTNEVFTAEHDEKIESKLFLVLRDIIRCGYTSDCFLCLFRI